jgi:tetratricopeptide (TPR) repeat protein
MNLYRQTNGPFENTTLKLLNSYATCARKHGDTDDLLATYEDFWTKRGSQLAWHARNISRVGQSLAILYFESGRQEEAMDLISDIRRHDEREYRLFDECTIASYKTESEFYFEREDYLNALRIHEEILRYYQSNYRTDNFMDMIQQFHWKGRALQRLGRWREARGIYDEAFALTMRYHGPRRYHVHKLANIKMWSEKGYERFSE